MTVMDWWDRGRQATRYSAAQSVSAPPTQTQVSTLAAAKPAIPAPNTTAAPNSAEKNSSMLGNAPARDKSSSFVPPKLVKRVEPQYTAQAASRKIEGKVTLRFTVTPNGSVRTIRVIHRLDTGLDRNAIDALAHWRYSPALVNGRPTAVQLTREIDFHLH